MPYLKEIVAEINRQLQVNIVNDKIIPLYNGICTVVPVLDEELSRFPTFMNDDGNAEFNAIDDRKNFCVYHKVNSKTINTYESNFGDGNDTKRMVVDMSLICFAKKSQLRISSDEIEDLKKQAKIYLDKIPNAEFRKEVWERTKELKLSALNKRSSHTKAKKN